MSNWYNIRGIYIEQLEFTVLLRYFKRQITF